MKIHQDCLECIYNQSSRVSSLLKVDTNQAKEISQIAKTHIKNFDFNTNPPHNAYPMYEAIAEYLGCSDIYKELKKEASKNSYQFIPTCKRAISESDDTLLAAIKTAVAGNVIDLAAEVMFDLDEEIEKIFKRDFAIDDFAVLKTRLKETKRLVYLADNAGEEIFDKLCIETIKKLFPQIEVYYFVRGKAIINDLTYAEAKASNLDEVATIIDSGVPTPGFSLELASSEAKALFNSADCIIAKGMGNYECLGETPGLPIFFLLKVKCQVVARSIQANLGDIVCKKGLS